MDEYLVKITLPEIPGKAAMFALICHFIFLPDLSALFQIP